MSSSEIPTIVLVPGLWEGTECFDILVSALREHHPSFTDVHFAPLKSTGTSSPGNPSMLDDTAGVHEVLEGLVKQGKTIILVGHSAGGFLASGATQDLEVGGSKATNGGGIAQLIYVASLPAPAGFTHTPMPFMDFQGDKMYCKDVENTLFGNVPLDMKAKYLPKCQHQPSSGWDATVPYAGFVTIPTRFVITELDAILPAAMQKGMIEPLGLPIHTANAGHMVQLTHPEVIVEAVVAAAEEIRKGNVRVKSAA